MDDSFLTGFWGVNEHISLPEIIERSVVMFLISFIIIRVAGMRSFRKNSPFDMVIAFLIGGVLSRGVVGATPFFSAVAGGVALIILQKLFYKLTLYNNSLETIMKGKRMLIYKDGKFLKQNMQKADVTTLEVFEDLRVEQQTESLDAVAEIYVEKTGEISFIKK
jgi:uncharacterized membrane protein YcaP (DUF421 family)